MKIKQRRKQTKEKDFIFDEKHKRIIDCSNIRLYINRKARIDHN
jgi:hypothetical protein